MTLPSPHFQSNQVKTLPSQKPVQQPAVPQKPHPKSNNFFCKYCQLPFVTETDLFSHRKTHTKCPYDECKFSANELTVSAHIQRVHIKQNSLVKIQDLTTPEQIEKWREERRKRYPTTQNVILRQQIQEEKHKRGEKLHESKKRFGDYQQRDFVRNLGRNNKNNSKHNLQNKSWNKGSKNDFNSLKHVQHLAGEPKSIHSGSNHSKSVTQSQNNSISKNFNSIEVKTPKVPELDSSDEELRSVLKFRGTSNMKDYHTVETIIKEKPALTLLGMYESDSENDESSNEEDDQKDDKCDFTASSNHSVPNECSISKDSQRNENFEVKLGKCEETVSSCEVKDGKVNESAEIGQSKRIECTDSKLENETVENFGVKHEITKCDNSEAATSENPMEIDAIQASDSEAPDELPIARETEVNDSQIGSISQNPRKRKRAFEKQALPKKKVRRNGLDYSKLKNRSINPFLEKLLERDIVHERNVLLQCVNFVVKNNFFGIGHQSGCSYQSTGEITRDDNDENKNQDIEPY